MLLSLHDFQKRKNNFGGYTEVSVRMFSAILILVNICEDTELLQVTKITGGEL